MSERTHEVIDAPEWAKPLPQLDNVNEEYWKAAREGRLLIQECTKCGNRQWYGHVQRQLHYAWHKHPRWWRCDI